MIIPTERNDITSQDVVIYKSTTQHPTGQNLMKICIEHPMYDPLMYVLIFPHGDKGWELGKHTLKHKVKSVVLCSSTDTDSWFKVVKHLTYFIGWEGYFNNTLLTCMLK